jgi:hypothetical protein
MIKMFTPTGDYSVDGQLIIAFIDLLMKEYNIDLYELDKWKFHYCENLDE